MNNTAEKLNDIKQPNTLIWKVEDVAKLYVADDNAIILKRNMNNKLKFADDNLKKFYNILKNELMSYKGVKSRMSNQSENFRLKRKMLAKIVLAGGNLKIFLALDVEKYPQNIYHQKFMGNMDLYHCVPFMDKIKTPLAARKACFLISEVMKNFGLQKNSKYLEKDYIQNLIPETNEALAKSRSVITVRESELLHNSLNKKYNSNIQDKETDEQYFDDDLNDSFDDTNLQNQNYYEKTENKLIWKVEDVAKLYVADDNAIILKRNMSNKLKFADEDTKQYYNTIKNTLMSYKGVKTRMSNVSENFRLKRNLICKITLAGENLKLFLALDVEKYPQNIYHQKNLGNMDLYINVPFMVKIKTKLAVRKACFLIDETMKNFGLQKNPKYVEHNFINELIPDEMEALAKSRSVITIRESEILGKVQKSKPKSFVKFSKIASDIDDNL